MLIKILCPCFGGGDNDNNPSLLRPFEYILQCLMGLKIVTRTRKQAKYRQRKTTLCGIAHGEYLKFYIFTDDDGLKSSSDLKK